MAVITGCDMCHKRMNGGNRCSRCEQAVLEDKFATLQKLYHGGKLNVDDRAMEQFLRTGKFQTLDEYLKTAKERRFQTPGPAQY